MQLFNHRQSEGLTLVFDGRQLAACAVFASTDRDRPVLASVVVVFDPKGKTDDFGRLAPVGFVATDSHQLGLVGSSDLSPRQLRNTLADDAMSYVMIERADIVKLKIGKTPTLVVLTVNPTGETDMVAYSAKRLGWDQLIDVAPVSLRTFQESVSVGHVIDAEYPNWSSLVPTVEPSLEPCKHLAFNPTYLARFDSFNKCFGKSEHGGPLVMLGAESPYKPAMFTMVTDGTRLVALQMPVKGSDVTW